MQEAWTCLTKQDLEIEQCQAFEEGRDLTEVESEFSDLISRDPDFDSEWQKEAIDLLDRVQHLPLHPRFPFHEPSDLEGILRSRPADGPVLSPPSLTEAALYDKMYGAWLGRCCGCLAGKPVEGRGRDSMERILKAQNRWPLSHYWSMKVAPQVAAAERWFPDPQSEIPDTVIEGMRAMPEDDDTNYTVAAFLLLKDHGPDFTPSHVGRFWLARLPYLQVFTAERVAYRNLLNLRPPPAEEDRESSMPTSATWCNPYREWIGAQIRGDFYGYAAPGRPDRAAVWAWRDACISHVKNGIYGAMWVAGMHAAAWATDDVERILRAGLAQIPVRSRLSTEIDRVLAWKREGWSFNQAADEIHRLWDERAPHHWCHTLSNAAIVAAALLWGDLDFESSVCRAVTCAFDTDCNGATVGSIVGLVRGAKGLPPSWTEPIRDTLYSGIHGMHELKLSELAKESCLLVRRIRSG
jgi:hypothetical protein